MGDGELVVVADGGEHADDGDGLHLPLHPLQEGPSGLHIQRGQLLPIELKAAPNHHVVLYHGLDILRPVHHGGDAGSGRRADPDQAHLRQVLALHNRVGALGRAQHRLPDLLPVHAGDLQHFPDGAENPLIHVIRGGVLDLRHNFPPLVDDDRVRVGAAHVDSQLVHYTAPPLTRSSSGM